MPRTANRMPRRERTSIGSSLIDGTLPRFIAGQSFATVVLRPKIPVPPGSQLVAIFPSSLEIVYIDDWEVRDTDYVSGDGFGAAHAHAPDSVMNTVVMPPILPDSPATVRFLLPQTVVTDTWFECALQPPSREWQATAMRGMRSRRPARRSRPSRRPARRRR